MLLSTNSLRFLLPLLLLLGCTQQQSVPPVSPIPTFLIGNFEDDYDVHYSITDSTFSMEDHTLIHVLDWNVENQFFIGQNDTSNIYDPLLYSRIDWMIFENMGAYEWGFCMSTYNAATLDSAYSASANRAQPKTGCNGYPFSRMKAAQP